MIADEVPLSKVRAWGMQLWSERRDPLLLAPNGLDVLGQAQVYPLILEAIDFLEELV
jgi:hypothetical protein